MTQEFEVTAEELVRVLQRRGIPLPSEIGAFVVLEACEKLDRRPAQLSTRDIFITEQGDVECAEGPRLESEAAAANALLGVLAELLVCAAPGVPPMLLDLVEHGPNERGLSLGLLRSDLEACLLPLNRGATRRVLSRLVREVRKAVPVPNARPLAPGADAGDVDATFDDLLGDSVPPTAAASQARARAAAVGGGEPGANALTERSRERVARERALHEAADDAAASERAKPAVDRAGPTPVPRAGSRAARRRASQAASAREQVEPAARGRREPAPQASPRAIPSTEPARRSDSLRAARESAFRGYSSQAPADSEQAASHAMAAPAAAEDAYDDASSPRERRNTRRRAEADGGGRRQLDQPAQPVPPDPDAVGSHRRSAVGARLDDRDDADLPSHRAAVRGESDRQGRRRTDADEASGRRRSAADSGDGTQRERRRSVDSRAPDPRASGGLREQLDSGRASSQSVHPSARATPQPKPSRAPLDADSLLEVQAARGRVGLWVFIASTAAAVALLLGYFALGREQTQSALGFLKPSAPAERVASKPPPTPKREYGDLRVSSKPERAQVLLLIGPGPALATDIPLGVAQEFVAIADNYRPARALLPADAAWDELDGQARYELAIQARPLGDGNRGRATDGLGATLLPQEVGAARGRLGSVRVVTTPRAAHVYQLIGFTPDVHVDNLPLDHPYEILVYLEGKGSVQKHIEPSDFQPQHGKRVASIDVQLGN